MVYLRVPKNCIRQSEGLKSYFFNVDSHGGVIFDIYFIKKREAGEI